MNREQLIEEHRGVIANFGDMSPIGNLARRTIRALEAAFEQASTPTDDEREALRDEWETLRDELAHWPIGSGYYQSSVGLDEAGEMADAILAAGFRRAVQGEPSAYRFDGESDPIATNPILRGVDLALERLVRRDCFTERTLRILDELRAEVLASTPQEGENRG